MTASVSGTEQHCSRGEVVCARRIGLPQGLLVTILLCFLTKRCEVYHPRSHCFQHILSVCIHLFGTTYSPLCQNLEIFLALKVVFLIYLIVLCEFLPQGSIEGKQEFFQKF